MRKRTLLPIVPGPLTLPALLLGRPSVGLLGASEVVEVDEVRDFGQHVSLRPRRCLRGSCRLLRCPESEQIVKNGRVRRRRPWGGAETKQAVVGYPGLLLLGGLVGCDEQIGTVAL
jgi:hypothetical protein